MLSHNQRLSLLLSLGWAVLLGAALVIAGVVWWRQTDGAAAGTSFACWLIMLAFCGAMGGYLRVLAGYIVGLQGGLNVARWFHQSLAIVLFGSVAGILAAALAYVVAECFFEIGSVRWLALCALASMGGAVAWPSVLRTRAPAAGTQLDG